jgi:hypothetical protein
VAIAFSVVFIYFSASSFWRARRMRAEAERSDG